MKTKTASVHTNLLKMSVVAAAMSGLIGCNSSSNSSEPEQSISVKDIEMMPLSDAKLMSASEQQVSLTLQNGLFLSATTQNTGCADCEFMPLADAAPTSTKGEFSGTTTQEQGVDESDRVKYDGNTLFIASNNQGGFGVLEDEGEERKASAFVRVMNRNADDSLSELANIEADKEAGYLSDLYLHQDVLTMIYDVFDPTQPIPFGIADIGFFPFNPKLGINFHNVEQADTPQLLTKAKIDGSIISSRRIDDKVYLVTRYHPELPENIELPTGETEQELKAFYDKLIATNLNDMLPQVEFADGQTKALVDADNCYLPQQHASYHGFTSITTVTTFDLDNPSEFKSSCVIAPLDGFYSSGSNMYLYEKQYSEDDNSYSTIIHKFGYEEQGVEYLATGSVPGHVSWNNSHLRFSEKDDYLRLVTSEENRTDENFTRTHRLFVLKQNNQQELETVAQLPNDNNPAAIGKPDEDIFAVRYFGDKAYIVTFRRTDPLYVIDLANPTAPVIQGELEIPGYSGYLQPINDKFVLGIGQQVDPNAEVGTPIVNEPNSSFVEGAKAELYDVSDPANPKVAATLVYPDVYSVAEWDYHALTQLKVSDTQYKFAFPIGGWSQVDINHESSEWTYKQAMQLVELDISGVGTLNNIGTLEPKTDYYGQWGDRAVLHGNLVYYIRDNKVWQSYWNQADLINGPY